jgi:riboflavin kinase/FMN adenylyltransferase
MQIHTGYKGLSLVDPVVTMGIFDGVHRGHTHLLRHLLNVSQRTGGESVVVTFYPHPRMILHVSGPPVSCLTTLSEKEELIAKAGIDHLFVLGFDKAFSRIKACDFIEDVLIKGLGTKHLIVGHDHHFGFMREGNFDTIKRCAGLLNFMVEKVEPMEDEKVTLSSTLIRSALSAGRIGQANEWLGYMYKFTGKVIEGKKLGRILGFPTANILPSDPAKLIPADGVYAVRIMKQGTLFKGMLSIGKNPTVNHSPASTSIEVNIFDFDEEIYGSELDLIFHERMRDEKKFATVDELVKQMELDRELALRLLS